MLGGRLKSLGGGVKSYPPGLNLATCTMCIGEYTIFSSDRIEMRNVEGGKTVCM